MNKKQKEFKKQMEKMLRGDLREIMQVNISIGQGGITGGCAFDRKLHEKFLENFGEKYEKLVEEFKQATAEPTKQIGRKLAKLIIGDALHSKVVDGTKRKELTDLLVQLGEVLGAEVKVENIDVMEIEDIDEDDDDEDEDDE